LVVTTWAEIESASIAEVLAWAVDQPWARAMAACGQDVHWHAEGDVWTHTRLVVGELQRLPEWADFNCTAQRTLLWAALFHDAGKPATTVVDPETGRTRSPKHAVIGSEMARNVLRELGCGLAQREAIANLVRHHGRPPFLLEKPDPVREVIELSWLTDTRLLHAFALADHRGRHSTEGARSEDDLHLGRVVAEENGCFGRPYPFANDHARFLFGRGALSSLCYTPREEYRCTVTLMAGLPGAGKDTWLARHRPALPVVSLDGLRAELGVGPTDDQGRVIQLARERCREHLRASRDFAFNATNTIRQTRQRWIDLFAQYAARVEVRYVEPPWPVVLRQNAARAEPVPRHVIERLAERLEPPTALEGHGDVMVG